MTGWGSDVELERRNRIFVALYAYSYEYKNDSLISDGEFDELSRKINLQINTGNEQLDRFFREEFEPDTGMWIHNHPDLDGLERLYVAKKSNKWFEYIRTKLLYKAGELC